MGKQIPRIRPVPKLVRDLLVKQRYRLSGKTLHWLDLVGMEPEDIIEAVLEGRLIKKESDETREARWKYTIHGPSRSGRLLYCAGKVVRGWDGQWFFVITAHWASQR